MASKDLDINIFSLPDEVLSIILSDAHLSFKDVLNFGETCKQYNEMVKENQIVWKAKLKTRLPQKVGQLINSECKGDWLAETRSYYILKTNIFHELMSLCSRFYKQDTLMTFKDVEVFFHMASSRNINYFLVTSVLCEVLKTGNQFIKGTLPAPRPYNLTDMYFAKIVLRYLIHAFLMINWVINFKLDVLTPENVIHFFHQWIDTANIHLIEDSRKKLNELAASVEAHLDSSHPFRSTPQAQRDLWNNGHLPNNAFNRTDCRKVLAAVKYVLYDERRFKDRLPLVSEDALDIVKALETNTGGSGSPTLLAVLFSYLCRRFGVRCDLITFSDHMYLEWHEEFSNNITTAFKINLANGELEVKKGCPFSGSHHASIPSMRKYCPDNLLTHLYGSFIRSMGAVKNWSTENVYCLYEFLRTNHTEEDQGPYKNFMLFLMNVGQDEVQTPLCFSNMDNRHLGVISLLVNMNRNRDMRFQIMPKLHDGRVRYAVGMVCYHTKYEYVCVIRGWDPQCTASREWQERMAISALEYGASQPYYQVLAADYSERYVAQENLHDIASPNRLYHLEDVLAPEFSYFDGFAYVPNEMKLQQYPNDGTIVEMYKNRRLLRIL